MVFVNHVRIQRKDVVDLGRYLECVKIMDLNLAHIETVQRLGNRLDPKFFEHSVNSF